MAKKSSPAQKKLDQKRLSLQKAMQAWLAKELPTHELVSIRINTRLKGQKSSTKHRAGPLTGQEPAGVILLAEIERRMNRSYGVREGCRRGVVKFLEAHDEDMSIQEFVETVTADELLSYTRFNKQHLKLLNDILVYLDYRPI